MPVALGPQGVLAVSTAMYWWPLGGGERLPDQLKRALMERMETRGEWVIGTFTEDYAYLEGLAAAGVEGAEELIEIIDEHGRIRLEVR